MGGGYGVAVWLEHVDPGVFVENARWIVDTKDLIQGLVKATVFGCVVTAHQLLPGLQRRRAAPRASASAPRAPSSAAS